MTSKHTKKKPYKKADWIQNHMLQIVLNYLVSGKIQLADIWYSKNIFIRKQGVEKYHTYSMNYHKQLYKIKRNNLHFSISKLVEVTNFLMYPN